jgi:hypothetical protein
VTKTQKGMVLLIAILMMMLFFLFLLLWNIKCEVMELVLALTKKMKKAYKMKALSRYLGNQTSLGKIYYGFQWQGCSSLMRSMFFN